MTSEVKSHRNLLLNLLREKLKIYQNEFNIRLIKIHELRDKFIEIKDINNEKKSQKIS